MIVVTPPAAAEAVARVDALARRAARVHVGVDVTGQDELPRGDVDALVPRVSSPGAASAAMRPSAMPISPSSMRPPGSAKRPLTTRSSICGSVFAPRRGKLATVSSRPVIQIDTEHPSALRPAVARAGATRLQRRLEAASGPPVEVVPYLEARDLSGAARDRDLGLVGALGGTRPGRARPPRRGRGGERPAGARHLRGHAAARALRRRPHRPRRRVRDRRARGRGRRARRPLPRRSASGRACGITTSTSCRPARRLPAAGLDRRAAACRRSRSEERGWWGTQFHPESYRSANPDGARILRTFFELAAER